MPLRDDELDFGAPAGSEAGLRRPAVVVTAARILSGGLNVIQVLPLTRTISNSGAEVVIESDLCSELGTVSVAQCQHIRAVATARVGERLGNVDPVVLQEVWNTLATIIDF